MELTKLGIRQIQWIGGKPWDFPRQNIWDFVGAFLVKISLKPIFLGLSWWKFPLNQDFLGFPGENFRKPIHWKMVLTAFDYGHWTGLSQNVGEVSRILQVTIWFIFYKSVNNSHVYHHWVTFGSVSITLSFSDFSSTNYLRLWMAWWLHHFVMSMANPISKVEWWIHVNPYVRLKACGCLKKCPLFFMGTMMINHPILGDLKFYPAWINHFLFQSGVDMTVASCNPVPLRSWQFRKICGIFRTSIGIPESTGATGFTWDSHSLPSSKLPSGKHSKTMENHHF